MIEDQQIYFLFVVCSTNISLDVSVPGFSGTAEQFCDWGGLASAKRELLLGGSGGMPPVKFWPSAMAKNATKFVSCDKLCPIFI